MFNDKPEKRGSTASALARSAAVRVLFAPYCTSSTAFLSLSKGARVRAALSYEHGGPEVIRIAEAEAEEPAPGEVQVAVRAASPGKLVLVP